MAFKIEVKFGEGDYRFSDARFYAKEARQSADALEREGKIVRVTKIDPDEYAQIVLSWRTC